MAEGQPGGLQSSECSHPAYLLPCLQPTPLSKMPGGGGLTAGREDSASGLPQSCAEGCWEFQKDSGKMAGIHGPSALRADSYNGRCPSMPGGMGSEPQMQLWDAAVVGGGELTTAFST